MTEVKKLEARKAELEKAINTAPKWSAAVETSYQDLQRVNRDLEAARKRAAPAPVPRKARKLLNVDTAPIDNFGVLDAIEEPSVS